MGSLREFQTKLLYAPDCTTFEKLNEMGVELQLLNKIGLAEATAISGLTEETYARLFAPDGSNLYDFPEGMYMEFGKEIVDLAVIAYVIQYPNKRFTIDQILWLFISRSDQMNSVITFVTEVFGDVVPPEVVGVPPSPMLTLESDEKPPEKTQKER